LPQAKKFKTFQRLDLLPSSGGAGTEKNLLGLAHYNKCYCKICWVLQPETMENAQNFSHDYDHIPASESFKV
jgi:hypothetical protein